jgi:thymidylate kinase
MAAPSQDELAKLRSRAESILTELAGIPPQRPVFVEFSGTPKSGKSTCIDIVAHFLRRLRFRTLAPTEGASRRTPYYLKDDWVAFNTWSANYALTHILEGLHHADRYHIAILDRGLFDALVWFEMLATKGEITPEERDRVHSFLLIDKWRKAVDAVFLFKTDPETSMERENRDKLLSDPGRAMNVESLTELNEAYDRVRERYRDSFRNFQVIDTSGAAGTTPQSTAFEVTTRILELFSGVKDE